MLGAGLKNEQPWQIAVTAIDNYGNASAISSSYDAAGKELETYNYVKEALQNGKQLAYIDDLSVDKIEATTDYGFSVVDIGRYMGANRDGATNGYWVDTDTLLPTNEQAADFVGCFRHELGHALGIAIAYETITNADLSAITGRDSDSYMKLVVNNSNDWTAHLIDQNGYKVNGSALVITSDEFAAIKAADASALASDYFIVDKEAGTGTAGKLYFVGDNVTEVLDGASVDGIVGLRVNGWEPVSQTEDKLEGSHLQTAGMMSHRSYTNYTTFLESELAVMQDLGYTLDRRAYYGKSIYKDGQTITNTQGYFARNSDGTAYLDGTYSSVPLGVGLHIYGAQNTVAQAANILTNGTGSVGIRVDGYENNLNITSDTTVSANGQRERSARHGPPRRLRPQPHDRHGGHAHGDGRGRQCRRV